MNNIELSEHHLKLLHYNIQNVLNNPQGYPFHNIAVAAFEKVEELFWSDVTNHKDLRAFVAVLIANPEFVNIEEMCKEWNVMCSITGAIEEIYSVPLFLFEGKWTIYEQ